MIDISVDIPKNNNCIHIKNEKPELFLEDNLRRIEEEINDLKRYWDDLSYWEREISIGSANRFLDMNLNSHKMTPETELRNNKALDELHSLIKLNDKERHNMIDKFIGKVLNKQEESFKPNYRMCINLLFVLPKLSPEMLNALDCYLGIDECVAKTGRSIELYNDVLLYRTQAVFFAFRNWLGKLYT